MRGAGSSPTVFDDGAPDIGRPPLPVGREVELPGRGRTFVRELAGPEGAPTVFLLHGWTVTAALNWYRQWLPLSEFVNVVALDHRGHGRGIRTPRRFRLEDAADDVAALADALAIDRFVVAGYSMGGPISQLVWQRHADRVDGMVLAATFAHQARAGRERALMRSIGAVGRGTRLVGRRRQLDLLTTAADSLSSAPDRPPWMLAEVRSGSVPMMLEAAAAIGRFDSSDWIGSIDVPTGIVVTNHDDIVSPGRQHHLTSLLPQAEVRFVDLTHDGCVSDPHVFNPPFLDLVRHAAGVA